MRAIVKYGQHWACVWFAYLLLSCCPCCVCLASAYQTRGYDNDSSKHELHKGTHILYNLKILRSEGWFGLVNVARMTCVNENVFIFSVALGNSTRAEAWEHKHNIVKKLLVVTQLLNTAVLSEWNHTGYEHSMGLNHSKRAVWLRLTQLETIMIHFNGIKMQWPYLANQMQKE